MAWRALELESLPGDTFLCDIQRECGAGWGLAGHAAPLGDHIVSLDSVEVVVEHPPRAPVASCFFVGHTKEDQITFGSKSRGRQVFKGNSHASGLAQHIDGASAPDLTINELTCKRITTPARRCHRHNVGVSHQAQRRGVGIAAFDPRHD